MKWEISGQPFLQSRLWISLFSWSAPRKSYFFRSATAFLQHLAIDRLQLQHSFRERLSGHQNFQILHRILPGQDKALDAIRFYHILQVWDTIVSAGNFLHHDRHVKNYKVAVREMEW